ncbi:MAG: hypothetical protein JW951_07355 [Lentisphaerae bacterium]|nr:hypothetical protein [Lentisphaerota bacterium]
MIRQNTAAGCRGFETRERIIAACMAAVVFSVQAGAVEESSASRVGVEQTFSAAAWAGRGVNWAGDFDAWQVRTDVANASTNGYLENMGGKGSALSVQWPELPAAEAMIFRLGYGWTWGGGGGQGTLVFGSRGEPWRLHLTFGQQPGEAKYRAEWRRDEATLIVIDAPSAFRPGWVSITDRGGGHLRLFHLYVGGPSGAARCA